MPGERILVVDDTALVRNVTRRMLEAGGYEVLEATSAEEALATFRALDPRPRVVLSDVVMPGMRGPELAGALRAIEPAVRVVLVSGTVEGPEVPLPSGVVFLEKPFALDKLLGTLRAALGDNESSRPG